MYAIYTYMYEPGNKKEKQNYIYETLNSGTNLPL